MVIFWGRPAAGRRFHRRGAHPPQPFTTNAAFRDLWNHAAVSRRRDADAPAVIAALPGCYGVFLPDDCAPLRWAVRGGPASTPLRWPLAEFTTQLRTLPTMPPSPRLSLPRRCRLPEFSTSLTPHSLGSGYHFFAAFYTFATVGCRCPWNHWLSLQPPLPLNLLGELLGEPSRSAHLHLVSCS